MKKLIIVLALLLAVPAWGVKLIPNGATSQSISVVIVDSDGDPNASVTITDLDLYCQKDGAGAQSAKIDVTALATADTAWTSGRAIHKGNGVYRIDIPDANLSDGAGSLLTYIIDDASTSNDTVYYEVQLVDAAYFTGLTTLLSRVDLTASDVNDYQTARLGDILTDTGTTIPGQVTDSNSYVSARVDSILDDTARIDTVGEIATAVWSAAAASYNAEDSFGNIINDVFSENANGTYYLDTLDEDFTTIDLNATTVAATLSASAVDAVWDELMSGHTTIGSAAAYMRSAAYDNRR